MWVFLSWRWTLKELTSINVPLELVTLVLIGMQGQTSVNKSRLSASLYMVTGSEEAATSVDAIQASVCQTL